MTTNGMRRMRIPLTATWGIRLALATAAISVERRSPRKSSTTRLARMAPRIRCSITAWKLPRMKRDWSRISSRPTSFGRISPSDLSFFLIPATTPEASSFVSDRSSLASRSVNSARFGGVFRYSTTCGALPPSCRSRRTLREVEQLGL